MAMQLQKDLYAGHGAQTVNLYVSNASDHNYQLNNIVIISYVVLYVSD